MRCSRRWTERLEQPLFQSCVARGAGLAAIAAGNGWALDWAHPLAWCCRLAVLAEVRAASSLDDTFDRGLASSAGKPFSVVHVEHHGVVVGVARSGRAHQHVRDRFPQCRHLRTLECVARAERIDAGTPERLRRVDVPEPRDEALIEQRRLDRTTTQRESIGELCRGPIRISGVGPETQIELGSGRMYVDRAQRAGIDEDERAAILEIQDGAGEARKLLRARGEHPIAVHAEVGVENAPIVEVEELMLPASFDARDPRPDQSAELCRLESTTQ